MLTNLRVRLYIFLGLIHKDMLLSHIWGLLGEPDDYAPLKNHNINLWKYGKYEFTFYQGKLYMVMKMPSHAKIIGT